MAAILNCNALWGVQGMAGKKTKRLCINLVPRSQSVRECRRRSGYETGFVWDSVNFLWEKVQKHGIVLVEQWKQLWLAWLEASKKKAKQAMKFWV